MFADKIYDLLFILFEKNRSRICNESLLFIIDHSYIN